MNLTRKVGPLPVWAWGAILGLVGYYVYSRYKSSSTTSASGSTAGVLDPNAVDPNTGFTYGEEESAALNANAAGVAGVAASNGAVDIGLTGTSSTDPFGNVSDWLTSFGNVASELGWTAPGQNVGSGSSTPSTNGSPSAIQVTVSPPMQQASPPTVAPSAHVASVPVMTAKGSAPWQNASFFNLTLGQVINTFRSPEATARYLYAKGYRPKGQLLNANTAAGQAAFANASGQTWVYYGPTGKSQLPNLSYYISKSGA